MDGWMDGYLDDGRGGEGRGEDESLLQCCGAKKMKVYYITESIKK